MVFFFVVLNSSEAVLACFFLSPMSASRPGVFPFTPPPYYSLSLFLLFSIEDVRAVFCLMKTRYALDRGLFPPTPSRFALTCRTLGFFDFPAPPALFLPSLSAVSLVCSIFPERTCDRRPHFSPRSDLSRPSNSRLSFTVFITQGNFFPCLCGRGEALHFFLSPSSAFMSCCFHFGLILVKSSLPPWFSIIRPTTLFFFSPPLQTPEKRCFSYRFRYVRESPGRPSFFRRCNLTRRW